MDSRRLIIICAVLAGMVIVSHMDKALAGKSSVQIEVPETAEMGSTVLIRINVSHEGNNFIHYTDWVKVTINDKEIKKWTFSNFDKPESENFTRTINHTMTEPITITAEADCNIHGSAGIVSKDVTVR